MKICKRCGHKWNPRVQNPHSCPKCKTYYWEGKGVDIKDDKKFHSKTSLKTIDTWGKGDILKVNARRENNER